jgi:recombination protein RecA
MAKKLEQVSTKLQDTLERMNKKYGEGTILSLGSRKEDYDIIPTGSIAFDHISLGVGGWVRGKLYELMGWEGSGKSTVCGHAVAECQKKGWKAFYIDSENAVDIGYFKKLNVNVNELLIVQVSNGEEGFNIAEELIKTGEFALGILDSDNGLIPKSVIEDGDIGDSSIGKKARLNSQAYPRLKNVLSEHNTCMIVVSQYREKIGVMFGPSTTTQGGHALKFTTDGRIEISKSLAKDGDQVYGNTTKIKCIKNKMSAPFLLCSFEIVFGKGIDKIKEIIELASEFEVIRKWGKTITVYGKQGQETKFPEDEYKKSLENSLVFDALKELVIEKLKNADIKVEELTEIE